MDELRGFGFRRNQRARRGSFADPWRKIGSRLRLSISTLTTVQRDILRKAGGHRSTEMSMAENGQPSCGFAAMVPPYAFGFRLLPGARGAGCAVRWPLFRRGQKHGDLLPPGLLRPHAEEEFVPFHGDGRGGGKRGFRPCLRCRPELAPSSPAVSLEEALYAAIRARALGRGLGGRTRRARRV
jgi:hypothetical protein